MWTSKKTWGYQSHSKI